MANFHSLEPHEMTSKQLMEALDHELYAISIWSELIAKSRYRISLIRAQQSRPLNIIQGQGKKTPRKKICRIHLWDSVNNRRIRGHKYDWRMPSYKGNRR